VTLVLLFRITICKLPSWCYSYAKCSSIWQLQDNKLEKQNSAMLVATSH